MSTRSATAASMFLFSFALVLFELLLTRLFGVVLFAALAHLALGLALLGISVGALAQHLWPSLVPEEGFEGRLAAWSWALGLSAVVAVLFTVLAPVTVQWAHAPRDFGERSTISWDLLDPVWYAALLPVLALPFAIAGLAFAGAFQRRKEHIGLLYGADLLGGAAAAVAFVPALYVIPGPDVVFLVVAAGALSAALLFHSIGNRSAAIASAVAVVVGLALGAVAHSTNGLIHIRYAAGYSESNVTYVKWTPLTRLAIHEDERGHYMLLDNTSASEIVRSDERRQELLLEPNRALVYQVHTPPARVAIIGASAGPELSVAQKLGYSGIDAIDIAPELGDTVAERYPDNPVNPYTHADTHRVVLDGRAAILHAREPYDIIQMVHANLHSSAGQLANAWSPALLETQEAFEVYLSRLTPDGTLSFARGPKTKWDVKAAVMAMRALGIAEPERNVVYVSGAATVMLAKKRPWTAAEIATIRGVLAAEENQQLVYDPTRPNPRFWADAMGTPLQTDDRPYLESPRYAWNALVEAFAHFLGFGKDQVEAVTVVYHSLAIQMVFVAVVTALCGLVPLLRSGALGRVQGVAGGLGYVACLGYGYLSVETVLLHQLVLFVGHPVYAITVVILAMLLFSGLGSIVVGQLPLERLQRTLLAALAGVVVLGAVQAYLVPPALYATALGLPIAVRVGIVFVLLAPLGFLMGMPFPLAMRILRPDAADFVPWAWAVNGLTSVVASMGTVVLSRVVGYDVAFAAALLAYAGALLLARTLPSVRPAAA
ncbi:MAG: hypothetical protein ABMA64_11980 [Myxococcota bacterium]